VLFLGAADDFDLTSVVETFRCQGRAGAAPPPLRVTCRSAADDRIWVEDADFGLGDQMATIVVATPANEPCCNQSCSGVWTV
jgi:hypothetical protein